MKYIIAGHGQYPYGVMDTIKFLVGERDDIFVISETLGDNDFQIKADELLEEFKSEEVIVFCDIVEGAVNQYFTRKLRDYDFRLIAGFNIAMILELLFKDEVSDEEISDIVDMAKDQLIYINDLFQ